MLAIKGAVSLACFICFLLLMTDVWDKYSKKVTTTGVRMRYNKLGEKKLLPCITFCPVSGFKTDNFFFQEKKLLENSLSIDEIFANETVEYLRNNLMYTTNEPISQLMGHCFTACNLLEKAEKEGANFFFKKDLDMKIKIFFHTEGVQFWITGFVNFPFAVSLVEIQFQPLKGMTSSQIALEETHSTFLSKKEAPCSMTDTHNYFLSCVKDKLWQTMMSNISCKIADMKYVIPETSLMSECENETYANIVYTYFGYTLTDFASKPWKYGCIVPCQQSSYKITQQNYHKSNTFIMQQYLQNSKNYSTLRVTYPTLTVEERIESLEYDIGSILSAAGGNLGLFLGFSCLSVIFTILSWMKKLKMLKHFQ